MKQPKAEQNRQPSLFELEKPPETASRPFSLPKMIFLGTSSFTASGWEGSLALKEAILNPTFAAIFTDENTIRSKWPVVVRGQDI